MRTVYRGIRRRRAESPGWFGRSPRWYVPIYCSAFGISFPSFWVSLSLTAVDGPFRLTTRYSPLSSSAPFVDSIHRRVVPPGTRCDARGTRALPSAVLLASRQPSPRLSNPLVPGPSPRLGRSVGPCHLRPPFSMTPDLEKTGRSGSYTKRHATRSASSLMKASSFGLYFAPSQFSNSGSRSFQSFFTLLPRFSVRVLSVIFR